MYEWTVLALRLHSIPVLSPWHYCYTCVKIPRRQFTRHDYVERRRKTTKIRSREEKLSSEPPGRQKRNSRKTQGTHVIKMKDIWAIWEVSVAREEGLKRIQRDIGRTRELRKWLSVVKIRKCAWRQGNIRAFNCVITAGERIKKAKRE